jgi:hypothetical protein
MQYVEETRRQQQQQSDVAASKTRTVFDPFKHTPSVNIQKVQVVKKTRSLESLAAAQLRVERDARFFKEKLLDLAMQSRSWMRDPTSVDNAIDAAFSSPPSKFPASVLYSRAVRFNEKNNLVRSSGDGPATATTDVNILTKDAFDAEGSNRA